MICPILNSEKLSFSHKTRHQRHNSQHKQHKYPVHDGAYLLCLAGEDLDEYPGENAEHNSVCDGVGQQHHDDGHVGADGVSRILLKFDLLAAGEHQHADVHQRRSCGEARDRKEERREDDGDQE